MRIACSLLVGLVFAAHALVGCGVHHLCQHGVSILHCTASDEAEHACHSHGCHHDSEPTDDGDEPSPPCNHSICSFVKAETSRVDFSDFVVPCFMAATAVESIDNGPEALACEPICRDHLVATHLYVWHCALII